MPIAVIESLLGIAGLTPTVDLYPFGSDIASFSGVSLSEATNRKGLYTGTVTAPTPGMYQAFVKSSGTILAVYDVYLTNDTTVHRLCDQAATLVVQDVTGAVPLAVAGASGGLFIAGTNDHLTITNNVIVSGTTTLTGAVSTGNGVTFSNASGDGFKCISLGIGGSGINAVGNSAGSGMTLQGGTNGNGLSTNGGTGSGDGIAATGGQTGGRGIHALGGPGGGSGFRCEATASNNPGFHALGFGTGAGMEVDGGATGDGMKAVAGTGGVDIRGNITGNVTGNLSGSIGSIDPIIIESGITAGPGLVNDAAAQLTTINARQTLALIQSACVAILAGAATTTVTIAATAKAAPNRVTATVDANGNRTAVNLQVPT